MNAKAPAKDKKPKVLALITARGGSKSVPGKNLKLLGGKPLIAWSIQAALQARAVGWVVVSTDDSKIAEVALEHGAEAPFLRPPELAGDASPHLDAIRHALTWLADNQGYNPEYLLLLQPTSPFRAAADIDAAVAMLEGRPGCSVVSVCEAGSHPYLVRTMDEKGLLQNLVDPPPGYLRRQDLPPAYAVNGALYLVETSVVLNGGDWFSVPCLGYVMPPERSLDIDSPFDLKLARLLMDDLHGN